MIGAGALAALLGVGASAGLLPSQELLNAHGVINDVIRPHRRRFKNPAVAAWKRTEPKPHGRGKKLRTAGLGGLRARIDAYQHTKARSIHELLEAA
jgi:hypothetical protein